MMMIMRRATITSKNSEALRRAKKAMAEELARTEAKEKAFTEAFDAIVKKQELDAQLGAALQVLHELNVPRKVLVSELQLSSKEIQRLMESHKKKMTIEAQSDSASDKEADTTSKLEKKSAST